ncbi:FMN-linked oxidoreductase [Conidiobolus coronatus NRRL 28638]|uniref:FMN-linked oxidoreductase n=1 Tax=Conidiobolus coronatus (strain ATCC 28846 / CBS 209.66 / NRRL 28638) TaxID=796925 RepID=A0A137P861_CONC2|nr:FMN-linked oxidoreductase [Conidiobolus coronatus NRRL 28638]|eukprot:KXN71195.1 FMN-linked oxidoreductase [Conidiobolus coronatus NRRL 28638]
MIQLSKISHYTNLQQPLHLGNLKLKNRILMSSLTRNCGTEWHFAPGLWSKRHVEAWKKVTNGVHTKGGVIFAQVIHFGRCANTLHEQNIPPPAPSAIRANAGKFRLLVGKTAYSTPEAIDDTKEYIQLFKRVSENAKLAAFDGVEFHTSGFVADQFLESHTNIRTDNYGGSIKNRSRFILEIIDTLQEVYDKKQIGVKLNPSGGHNDSGKGSKDKIVDRGTDVDIQEFLPLVKNALLSANTGFITEEGNNYVGDGKADAITYGRPFINNPDLPYIFFNEMPLNLVLIQLLSIHILKINFILGIQITQLHALST